jgi:biotin synthase
MFDTTIHGIAERVVNDPGYLVSFEDACKLAAISREHAFDLIACAGKIRTRYRRNRVFTCSIVNAKSGFCSEDCAFCAQSSHHETDITTYPLMSEDELTQRAVRMHESGATNYSMVTSGYDLTGDEIATVCGTAAAVNKKTGMKVCASLGMLSQARAKQLKENGVGRYHHNLETARSHFNAICTTHEYDEDIETVKIAKAAGLEVCSGCIMGLGENWEQRVELAFTLRELDVDSIPINFLNPIPGTRMEKMNRLSPMEALRCIALFRFIHPRRDITICGGREITLGDFQSWIFAAGANGLMIGDYLTTKGRSAHADIQMIEELGLESEKPKRRG